MVLLKNTNNALPIVNKTTISAFGYRKQTPQIYLLFLSLSLWTYP
jgi:hypothetical protein